MTFDTALAGSGIVAASISGDVGRRDVRGRSGQDARRMRRRRSTTATRTSPASTIPNVSVTRRTREVVREKRTGHNVVALSAGDAPRRPQSAEAVGRARRALRSSRSRRERQLARDERRGRTASTTAPTTTRRARPPCWRIAEALCEAAAPPQRAARVLVGRGARPARLRSVRRQAADAARSDIAAYLNFDMVGRMQDNKLTVQATGHEPGVGEAARAGEHRRRLRSAACSRIRISRPTSRRFNTASVPSLNFFTGAHADYHKPTRHGRQDRLRGSRSRRRLRRGDRPAR